MGRRSLAVFMGTASTIAWGIAMPASAQRNDQPAAQESAGAGVGLEEVVVTARRREERAQTVPISLTVLTEAQIDQQEIHNVNDLQRDVPALNLCCGTEGKVTFTWIRGVTGVIGYFDDAPVDLYGPSMYFDQASTQVLKGPQGTLFGLSTNGGAILYESKQPSDQYEGFVQAEGGNLGHYQFQGAVNVPVVPDKLLVRVGAEIDHTDGYIHDIEQNVDLAEENYWIARVSATLRPTDDLQNTTVVNYSRSDTHDAGDEFVPYEVNPKQVFGAIPLGPSFSLPLTLGNGPSYAGLFNPATAGATVQAALAAGSFSLFPNIAALYAQQRKLGWYSIIGTDIPGGPYLDDSRWNIVNTTTWDINDDFTIKNVASYQQIQDRGQSSTSLLPINLLNQAEASGPLGPDVQYTSDLQLQGKVFNERLSFTLGGFGLLSWPETTFPGGAYFPGRSPHSIQYNCAAGTCTGEVQISHRNTLALYGQGAYDLSDFVEGLSFTVGYRYTWDRAYENDTLYTSAGVPTSNSAAHALFQAPSQLYLLQYKLSPTSMVYASYSKGFSTGGFNGGNPAPYPKEYQPEVLKNFEIGIKSDFDLGIVDMDGVKARTNFAAYHGDYDNIKQNVTIFEAATSQLAVITLNVASAYVEGVEGEITLQPIEDLEIGTNFAWNHVAFTHFIDPVNGENEASAPQSYNPYWQYNINGTYHFPIDRNYGDVSFTAIYSWVGKRSNTIIIPQLPQNVDPAFDNLDMNVQWRDVWGEPGVTVRGWVTNVLGNHWNEGSLAAWQSLGILDYSVAKPREYGVTVRYDFGAPSVPEAAPTAYAPPPVQAPAPAPAVARSYMVFFDFNTSDLTAEAVAIVDAAAKNAGPAKATELVVTGHTDTVGSDAYNLRLSRRRAESVAAQLEKQGIASSEIEIVAKGKHDLLAPTGDGVREPRNRRVTIVYGGGTS